MLERLVDQAALELGIDPIEIRRRNFLGDDVFPFRTLTGNTYDSGRYSFPLDRAAEAAGAAGASRPRVLFKHILPLCWTPVLISATMDLGQVILLAASLSFIGLGATPPSPEWGSMISDGAAQFYSWWVALGPGLAILSIVLGFNFIGDGLHDYFDPRSK